MSLTGWRRQAEFTQLVGVSDNTMALSINTLMRYNSRMLRFTPGRNIGITVSFVLVITIASILQTGCFRKPSAPEHLRILFTTDTQGNFTPCGCSGGPRGGMQARSTAIREERESAPGAVLLLDTGNFSSGITTEVERTKAEFVTDAMAFMGYDAVNVGQRDAKRPREGVLSYDKPGCPLTSAGYTYENPDTGEREFSYTPDIIVDIDGYKVGIVGSPMDDLRVGDFGFQNEPTTDILELLDHINSVLNDEGAKIVIMITDNTQPREDARLVSSRFIFASIVIGGEAAPADYTESKSGEEIFHPVFIPRALSWGRSLGVLDLELSPMGGIRNYTLRYVDLNEDVEKDPAFEQMTEEYLAAVNAPPTGIPEMSQTGYIGSELCKDCHLWEYETWQESRHSEAWETLESADRLRESTCIPCHTTGYTASETFPSVMVPYELRGVGCESCHGPGENHKLYQEYVIYGELTGEERGEGLTDPIILTPPESTCLACHQPPYDEGWLYNTKILRILHE